MSPELKYHSIVVSITTALVFAFWLFLNDLILKYPLLSAPVAGVIALGTYKFTALLLLSMFRHFVFIKRFILGPYHLEGSWAGFYIGKNGDPRYFIETFEQSFTSLVIRGKAFKENGEFHGGWVTDNANIDVNLGRLTYYFKSDPLSYSSINHGIACFDLDRPAPHKPAQRIVGFSSELIDGIKLRAIEEKISENTLMDIEHSLEKAKEIYIKNKNCI